MVWHEIVNDRLGGRAIAVTYCPLCNSSLVFDRQVDSVGLLRFGATGNLRHSDRLPTSSFSPPTPNRRNFRRI